MRQIPAQSRTNLGRTSLSSYFTKQFSLPHHAQDIEPYASTRWTGQTLLVELPNIPAHPAPIPWWFPGPQVTALTKQASNCRLPVSPPATDLHTGSRSDWPPMHPQQFANTHQFHCSHTLNPHRYARTSWCHHYITSWSHSPSFLHANFVAVRQNKFGFSGDLNKDFSGGSSTS